MKFLTSKETEVQYVYKNHMNNLSFETYFKCILKGEKMLIPINLRKKWELGSKKITIKVRIKI